MSLNIWQAGIYQKCSSSIVEVGQNLNEKELSIDKNKFLPAQTNKESSEFILLWTNKR